MQWQNFSMEWTFDQLQYRMVRRQRIPNAIATTSRSSPDVEGETGREGVFVRTSSSMRRNAVHGGSTILDATGSARTITNIRQIHIELEEVFAATISP